MLNLDRSKGMIVDGVAGSEAIDSSGEILSVSGADISDFNNGTAVINWEHRGDDAPGASPLDVIGRILYAKKIFGPDDCETKRQKEFWEEVKLPYIYFIGRLRDGAGHPGAIAAAANIRDDVVHGDKPIFRWSVEGSTLEERDHRLLRTVCRRLACTIKPCNRSVGTGILKDPGAPKGFETAEEGLDAPTKDIVAKLAAKFTAKDDEEFFSKAERPDGEELMFRKLGASWEKAYDPTAIDDQDLHKALSAGGYGGAPGSLVGGSALQREEIGGKVHSTTNAAKAALRDWWGGESLKGTSFEKFLKMRLPEVSDQFIQKFAAAVDDYRLKGGARDAILKTEAHLPLMAKMEQLAIELQDYTLRLQKADEQEAQGVRQFQGKTVVPGLASVTAHGGKSRPFVLLGGTPTHHIGHYQDDPSQALRRIAKDSYKVRVHAPPRSAEGDTILQAEHGIPELTQHHEQKALLHGMKLAPNGAMAIKPPTAPYNPAEGMNTEASYWAKGPAGQSVFVKGSVKEQEPSLYGEPDTSFSEARREAAYHNLAKGYFGLGDYITPTAAFQHPVTGSEMAIVEGIPDAEHYEGHPEQKATLRKLHDAGELDKLFLMNHILGNTDRNDHNYVHSKSSRGGIKLIDHGLTFNDTTKKRMGLPSYMRSFVATRGGVMGKVHPAAQEWLHSLDPLAMAKHLRANGVPPRQAADVLDRLVTARAALRLDPELSRMGVMTSQQQVRAHAPNPFLPPAPPPEPEPVHTGETPFHRPPASATEAM